MGKILRIHCLPMGNNKQHNVPLENLYTAGRYNWHLRDNISFCIFCCHPCRRFHSFLQSKAHYRTALSDKSICKNRSGRNNNIHNSFRLRSVPPYSACKSTEIPECHNGSAECRSMETVDRQRLNKNFAASYKRNA